MTLTDQIQPISQFKFDQLLPLTFHNSALYISFTLFHLFRLSIYFVLSSYCAATYLFIVCVSVSQDSNPESMEKSQHSHLSIKHPKGWCWTNCSFTSIRKKQHFWCPTLFWLVVSLYHTYTLGFITSENFSGVYWSVIRVGPIPGAAPLRLLGLPQKRRMVISVNPREILGLMHSTLVPPNSVTSNLWFWAIRAKIFFDKWEFCRQKAFLVKNFMVLKQTNPN